MSFHVGQRVVCIHNGSWVTLDGFAAGELFRVPRKGEVFTVAAIDDSDGSGTYLGFAECAPDHGYDSRHFRPVKKTSISVFTRMLIPKPKKVRERA